MRPALLLSYFFWDKVDLDKVFAAWPERPLVFADSGGFSASTIGAEVKLEDYAAWLKRWSHIVDVACTLDVVGDAAATTANVKRLEDLGCPTLPVFHVGEPWEALDRYCAEYPFICIGGMVPWGRRRKAVMRWILRCMRVARDAGVVVHGLGQTNWRSITGLPFFSADSSSACSGERFGTLKLWDEQQQRMQSFTCGENPQRCASFGPLFRAHGLDPKAFSTPYFARKAPDGSKTPDQWRDERWALRGANIRAWLALEEWWHKRFGPIEAPGCEPGPHVFLVVLYQEQIDTMYSVIYGDGSRPRQGAHVDHDPEPEPQRPAAASRAQP